MFDFIIGLIAGLLLGANLGMLVVALLRAGREEDEPHAPKNRTGEDQE